MLTALCRASKFHEKSGILAKSITVNCQTDRNGNVSHVSLALETVKWEIHCPCGHVGLGSLFRVFMGC